MTTATIPQAVGDWNTKGRDADQVFACQTLSDTALSAAVRVSARFDPSFPGWQLYRRVVAGVGLHDRQLEAWAIGCARALARSHKLKDGRPYVRADARLKPGWIAQAGRDALDFAIYGKYPAGLGERGDHFGVSPKTYQAIRDPVAAGMVIGFETFAAELRSEYFRVRKQDIFSDNGTGLYPHGMVLMRASVFAGGDCPVTGDGCFVRSPAPNPDTL